ncbi:hypothetical protein [Deinococcus sp. JMULE3]|uniref:hypothetical protein n=1 Tax=Deinococcus sp. JMULE3 TaxID=2518341 RepID=UPI0015775705|nr:hypothetical protein [Deinococcus sp. JMULE3]NTY01131.1 hypothetical protein [Deinococcus sp. JMULE3]
MNLRRQMLISAALMGAAAALQVPGLIRDVQRPAADFPWFSLIGAALILGAALGTLLHALWPVRGERPVRDWRASLPFYLLPTLALLLGGALLIDRVQAQRGDALSLNAFVQSAREVELRATSCASGAARSCTRVQANVDGPLMAELLQSAVTDAGGRIAGGTLPLTRQGDRVTGEAKITLRAGLRQVPFTLRYDGPVIVGRAAPLPDSALPLAQATLERAHD